MPVARTSGFVRRYQAASNNGDAATTSSRSTSAWSTGASPGRSNGRRQPEEGPLHARLWYSKMAVSALVKFSTSDRVCA